MGAAPSDPLPARRRAQGGAGHGAAAVGDAGAAAALSGARACANPKEERPEHLLGALRLPVSESRDPLRILHEVGGVTLDGNLHRSR